MSQIFSAEDQRRWNLFNGPQRDPTADAARHGFAYQSKRARKGQPLTAHDFMPCGPYTGHHLHAVPAAHLIWVQSQPWSKTWPDWLSVADYLERNPPVIPVGSSQSPQITVQFFVDSLRPCEKSARFPWEQDAILYTLPGSEFELHAFAAGALRLRIAWYVTTRPGSGKARIPVMPHYRIHASKHAAALQHLTVHLADPATTQHHMHLWAAHLGSQLSTDTPAPPRRTPLERLHRNGRHCLTLKQGYTKKEAETHLNARRHGRNAPGTLRIYQCPDCNQWHLTKQPLRFP